MVADCRSQLVALTGLCRLEESRKRLVLNSSWCPISLVVRSPLPNRAMGAVAVSMFRKNVRVDCSVMLSVSTSADSLQRESVSVGAGD